MEVWLNLKVIEYYIRVEKANKFLSHNHLPKPFKIIKKVFETRFCKISQTIPKMTTSKQMSLSLQKVVIFRMAELFPVNVSSWYLAMHIRYTFLCQLYFIHVNSLVVSCCACCFWPKREWMDDNKSEGMLSCAWSNILKYVISVNFI